MNPSRYLYALMLLSISHQTLADSDIEKITVTANRQLSPLSQVTGNLAWLDQQSLEVIQHQHVNQALMRIPGTWISRGNGQEHLTAVRSPVLTGAGGCGAFLMAEDGISLRAPGFCNANQLFDANTEQASQIEVIRGPGSALYGSNAVHGVINILSAAPLNGMVNSLAVEAGPHDYLRGKVALASQSSDRAFGLYANVTDDGGYQQDSGFTQQKANLVYQSNGTVWRNKSMLSVSRLDQQTAGFIQGFEAYKDPQLKRTNPNPEAFREASSLRAYSKFERDLDRTAQVTIIPYLRWNEMEFLQHFLPWKSLEENGHSSIGLQTQYNNQWSIQSGTFAVTAGLDLDYTEGELQETQAQPFSPTIPQGDHYDYRVNAGIVSPYAQLRWLIDNDLTLEAGLRFDHSYFDYDNRLSDGSACAPEVTNCRFTRPSDQRIRYNEWSPKLAARWNWSSNHLSYLQFSQGYRAPQATELFRLQQGQQSTDLEAEKLNAWELGWRGQAGELFYDLSLFHMDKDNFIFQDTNRQNISNGKTRHQGVELSLRYQFDNGIYLAANGTLAEHSYQNALTLSRQDIQGNEIDTAPEHIAGAQLGWRSTEGHGLELEWQHMGNYYLNPENTAEYPGHQLLHLSASYQFSPSFKGTLRLLNLTDEDYAERADFAFGNYRYFVGEPRSLFVSVSWQGN